MYRPTSEQRWQAATSVAGGDPDSRARRLLLQRHRAVGLLVAALLLAGVVVVLWASANGHTFGASAIRGIKAVAPDVG